MSIDRSYFAFPMEHPDVSYAAHNFAMTMNTVEALISLPVRLSMIFDKYHEANDADIRQIADTMDEPIISDEVGSYWLKKAIYEAHGGAFQPYPIRMLPMFDVPAKLEAIERSENPFIRPGFDSLVHVAVVQSWSALEVLQADLKRCVRKSPLAPEERRAVQQALDHVASDHHLSLLAKQVRHVVLHAGGIIDKDFLANAEKLGFNVSLSEGDRIPASGELALDMMNDCIRCAAELIHEATAKLAVIAPDAQSIDDEVAMISL